MHFKGIVGFVDKGGAGHKLKKSNLDQAEALLKQPVPNCKERWSK